MASAYHTHCPICEQHAELKFKEHCGYLKSVKFDIYHCRTCYTAFAAPLKTDHSIYDLIYRNIDRVPGYIRYLTYAEKVIKERDPLAYLAESEDVYWSIAHYLKSKPIERLKILEIGSGFGYLTYALAKRGYNIKGIDISHVAVEQASKRYGPYFECRSVEELAQLEGPAYDLVIFTEVIEHIEDVKGFLKAANALLKSGGDLILTTPNRTPYPEDVLWETEPPPVHLWWFSEKSIALLAKQIGLTAHFINFYEYNLKELVRTNEYQKPYLAIRNLLPSRLPRFNVEGEVSHYGDHVLPSFFYRVKRKLRKLLGIKWLQARVARKKGPSMRRPVLCAVLSKPLNHAFF